MLAGSAQPGACVCEYNGLQSLANNTFQHVVAHSFRCLFPWFDFRVMLFMHRFHARADFLRELWKLTAAGKEVEESCSICSFVRRSSSGFDDRKYAIDIFSVMLRRYARQSVEHAEGDKRSIAHCARVRGIYET